MDIEAEDSDETSVWDLAEIRGFEELTILFEALPETRRRIIL